MKILIISDAWYPQLNGVVRTYEQLIVELKKMDHDVHVIGPQDFKRRFKMPGYQEIDLVFGAYRPLKKMIQHYQPDTIHIATEGPLGWAGRKFCLKNNIKFTTCYHTQFPDYIVSRVPNYLGILKGPIKNLAIKFIRQFHNHSSAILVTTQTIENELKRWDITSPMLPFTRGVDTEIFYPKDVDIFSELKKPIALYVGRLAIEKNIEDFLNIPWQGSKVIVGHGPDEKKLKKAYPDAIFVGKKTGEDLANHYRSADIFVFPSTTDTFGMVLIEALACGLPIAAYPVMGPQDIITDGILGVLDKDLSRAVEKAIQTAHKHSPEKRHNHVVQNYTWAKATEQFLEAQKTTMNK